MFLLFEKALPEKAVCERTLLLAEVNGVVIKVGGGLEQIPVPLFCDAGGDIEFIVFDPEHPGQLAGIGLKPAHYDPRGDEGYAGAGGNEPLDGAGLVAFQNDVKIQPFVLEQHVQIIAVGFGIVEDEALMKQFVPGNFPRSVKAVPRADDGQKLFRVEGAAVQTGVGQGTGRNGKVDLIVEQQLCQRVDADQLLRDVRVRLFSRKLSTSSLQRSWMELAIDT